MNAIPWSFFNYDTTPEFSLKGTECIGRVVQIHDGDTLTIIIPVFTTLFKFSVRLAGIDTCEMTSKNETTKELAIKAKKRLLELVTATTSPIDIMEIKRYLMENIVLVYVKCQDFDKYGRLLAEVSKEKDSELFSNILLTEKLAYSYDGKKKLTEEEQIKFLL